MDETAQQIVALLLVAIAIVAELWRRRRKQQAGKAGCDGCDTSVRNKNSDAGEQPVQFYRRR